MTDEQYIDDLFAREGIGWDKTPGFRAFVLDLMGIIGERPRAGDVSSMHLAYTAGLEHGQEWTDERPTEPGDQVMTDYQKGVRAAVLIIAGLCGLCVLASLSGCLTAAKLAEMAQRADTLSKGAKTDECADAAANAASAVVVALGDMTRATKMSDPVRSPKPALRVAEVACLECVNCAADQECVGGHCRNRRR